MPQDQQQKSSQSGKEQKPEPKKGPGQDVQKGGTEQQKKAEHNHHESGR
jgi:hypothetical protein